MPILNLDDKIEGWLKILEDSCRQTLQKKSGQAADNLTPRSQWQLKNFIFLKQHTCPRSHT